MKNTILSIVIASSLFAPFAYAEETPVVAPVVVVDPAPVVVEPVKVNTNGAVLVRQVTPTKPEDKILEVKIAILAKIYELLVKVSSLQEQLRMQTVR